MADNLFAICKPRSDVLEGALKESDFAADLSQVLRGDAPDEYKKPELFFANTYPTKGLKNVDDRSELTRRDHSILTHP